MSNINKNNDEDQYVESMVSMNIGGSEDETVNQNEERSTETIMSGSDVSERKPIVTSNTPRNNSFNILVLFLGLFVAIALFVYVSTSADHLYYVESSIQFPPSNDTTQTVMIIGACVHDYTKVQTKETMIDALHQEYNYKKSEQNLVQNMVSVGCDEMAQEQLPEINFGNKLQSIF